MNLCNMKMLFTVLFALTILLMIGCIDRQTNNGHNRPINVPKNTFWVGGKDGGQWYKISNIDSIAETVHFIIYNDNNGTIVSNKNFKLNCSRNIAFQWQRIPDYINGFDGNRILLNQISLDKSWCYFE